LNQAGEKRGEGRARTMDQTMHQWIPMLSYIGTVSPFWAVSVLVSVAVVVGAIVDYFFDSRVYDKRGKLMPGPRSNLYGLNFYSVVQESRKSKQATKVLCEVYLPKVGDGNLVATNLFSTRVVIVGHPDYIRTVLSGSHIKFPKSTKYLRLKFFLGEGLVTASGAKWQAHRTMISPGFHADAQKHFVGLMNAHCNRRIKSWLNTLVKTRTQTDDQAARCGDTIRVDINKDITHMTLSVICDAAFGYKFDTEDNGMDMSPFFNDINDEMNSRILDPFDWWPVSDGMKWAELYEKTFYFSFV
jgi:Cytochrome P450